MSANRAALVFFLAALGAPPGCARHAASQATAGAMESIEKGVKEEKPPGERPIEITAVRAVDAAAKELASPEQIAHLRKVAEAAATAAVQRAIRTALEGNPSPLEQVASEAAGTFRETLSSGLAQDLGQTGPLATSLGGTVHLAAASATDGAFGRIFPGCAPADDDCVDRRIALLSHQAAAGFGAGLKKSLGIGVLVLAFLTGAVVTLMVVLVVQFEVKRREPHPEVARAH